MTQSDPTKTSTEATDKTTASASSASPPLTPANFRSATTPTATAAVKAEETSSEKAAESAAADSAAVLREAEKEADAVPQGAAPGRVDSEPEVPSEDDASDAQLRTWARDNGIEDVPSSGKLSAAWREQITAAIAADLAMDPKDEGSVKPVSPTSSETTSKTGDSTYQENLGSAEEEKPESAPEYRSVWEAPDTWVSGQTYTA